MRWSKFLQGTTQEEVTDDLEEQLGLLRRESETQDWIGSTDPESLPTPCLPDRSDALEMCCVCLEPLCADEVTPFLATEGWTLQPASCRHFCHVRCAQRLRPQRCPVCRVSFCQLRRISRDGILGMTASEVLQALEKLHGRVSVKEAVELFCAVFPVPPGKATERLRQLALQPPPTTCTKRRGALDEKGFARFLRHISLHCVTSYIGAPMFNPRMLSFYEGLEPAISGTGPQNHFASIEARRRQRRRRVLLRCCAIAGGALHGLVVGCLAGALCGLVMRKPPSSIMADDCVNCVSHPPDTVSAKSSLSLKLGWLDVIGRFLDSSPWHVFSSSAILAAGMVLVIACLALVSLRLLLQAGKAAAFFWQMAHRSLWLWAMASLGYSSGYSCHNEEVGRYVWSLCTLTCSGVGLVLGLFHAAALAEPARRRPGSSLPCAAADAFYAGASAQLNLCCRSRRARRKEAEWLGDGSLRDDALY